MNSWKQVKDSFLAWHDRACSHTELRNLSDRTLRDIGLRRGDERCYSTSPFGVRGVF